MRTEWSFEQRSTVPASAADVWLRVVSPDGINDEMRPWMTMSLPVGIRGIAIDDLGVGRPVGRAWLRLLGILPFDYDDLVITELDAGRRFREESTMLSMRRWVHERTVEPVDGDHAEVVDRITFRPRRHLVLLGPVLLRVLRAFFGHRHRRLLRHFGG